MPNVNPRILEWARLTAGLSLEQAAKKVGLNAARGISGEDRLTALEAGEGQPTTALLRRMSDQYRRPLLTFFLREPPQEADRGTDFRTLPEQGDPSNVLLNTLIRDIKVRQGLVRDLLLDDDDARPVGFVGSMTQADGKTAVAAAIAERTGVDRERFRASQSVDEAFNTLRSGVEAAGVFVVLAGTLGSHHTAIDVETFRGFALADPIAPFIVVNDQDAKQSWSFTLLHELAHIFLGETGISGATPTPGVERFCNDVAAEFLLAADEIDELQVDDDTDAAEADRLLAAFAADRNVSRNMVAYNLFRSGHISQATWQDMIARFRAEWIGRRAVEREAASGREGGPNYYTVRRHRVGTALISLVRHALAEGEITPIRAGKVLGVKPMNVYALIAPPRRNSRAA